jgi:hypothetical protein
LVDGKRREESYGGEPEKGVESFLLAEKVPPGSGERMKSRDTKGEHRDSKILSFPSDQAGLRFTHGRSNFIILIKRIQSNSYHWPFSTYALRDLTLASLKM